MIYRSRAPLRVSFAGGGTDISPYLDEKGGVVLSTTIDKYCYSSLLPRDDDQIKVTSLDLGVTTCKSISEVNDQTGALALVDGVIKNIGELPTGFELFIHSDAPPGSGLGSSSAMAVTLLGAFKNWLQKAWSNYQIAELAYFIERIDLGIQGGKQDQYAAAFGGFNFIEFYKDGTVVNPLRVNYPVLNELEYHLILCYTGKTRLSSKLINAQVKNYVQGKDDTVRALDELKQITIDLKNALLKGNLNTFGYLLHEAWENKKKLAQGITDEYIDELYAIARKNGAIGGKILGAGGGGYLLVYCPAQRKHIIATELEKYGGQIIPMSFDYRGLYIWKVFEERQQFIDKNQIKAFG